MSEFVRKNGFFWVSLCAQAGVRTGVGGQKSLGEDGMLSSDFSIRDEAPLRTDIPASNADMSGIGRRRRGLPPLLDDDSDDCDTDKRGDTGPSTL